MAKLIWQSAREQADELLKTYWDGKTLPVPVIAIGSQIGIRSYTAPLPAGMSGMIIKNDSGDARAYADESESSGRKRFTFAHEVGHFVERTIVSGDPEFSFEEHRNNGDYGLHEFYADEFAGALLMPEEDIKARLHAGDSIYALAKRYGVTPAAVAKRLERLRKTNSIAEAA